MSQTGIFSMMQDKSGFMWFGMQDEAMLVLVLGLLVLMAQWGRESATGIAAGLLFHATKLFTTAEGGALISHSAETEKRIYHLKNFGISGEETVVSPGINGKMNELQAALGLSTLSHVQHEIARNFPAEI